MHKPATNKTISIRFDYLKIADLKRQAATETLRRGYSINYLDLVREAVEAKYFVNNVVSKTEIKGK